jgi:demethylphylloquinone reductase
MTSKRITILGGGFGGLYAALRLDRLQWQEDDRPEITLVDRSDRFVFAPLLYELVTQEMAAWEIAPAFSELLKDTRIRYQRGNVAAVNIGDRRVELQDGSTLEYDRLVLSLGGETPRNLVAGADIHAIPFRTVEDADRLGERLRILAADDRDRIRIAIIGAGYSGVELACKLADKLGDRGRIRLVEAGDRILAKATDFNRQAAQKALEKRNVWIDFDTTVTEITAETISLKYKETIDTLPVEIVLWTIGNDMNPAIKTLDLPKNDRGQLLTNNYLQSTTHKEIYALGDAAQIRDKDGTIVPPTGQAAMQAADYVAWNVWASLNDRPCLEFRYENLGEMMALGADGATLEGLGIQFDGPLAYLTRRLVYLYRMPTFEHQIKVGINWLTKPITDLISNI